MICSHFSKKWLIAFRSPKKLNYDDLSLRAKDCFYINRKKNVYLQQCNLFKPCLAMIK